MYNLDTITHAIRAIQTGGQPPEPIISTGSRQFHSAWEMFVEDIKLGKVDVHSKWQTTARVTNATGTGVFPHNRVDQATRFVAGSYILCGYELATPQRKQLPDGFGTPSTADTIAAHAVIMIDTGKNLAAYLERQTLDIRTAQTLRNSIGEFYSLLIVALHEIRRSVGQPYHDAVDKGIEHCERQLSRHGATRTIPPSIARQIKQAKFQQGVDAVRDIPDGTHPQQQRPQLQGLQSRTTAPEPIAGNSTVVTFDAAQWHQKLKDRAAKAGTDKPKLS